MVRGMREKRAAGRTDLLDVLDDGVLRADVERLDVVDELLLALALHRAAQNQQQRLPQLLQRRLCNETQTTSFTALQKICNAFERNGPTLCSICASLNAALLIINSHTHEEFASSGVRRRDRQTIDAAQRSDQHLDAFPIMPPLDPLIARVLIEHMRTISDHGALASKPPRLKNYRTIEMLTPCCSKDGPRTQLVQKIDGM